MSAASKFWSVGFLAVALASASADELVSTTVVNTTAVKNDGKIKLLNGDVFLVVRPNGVTYIDWKAAQQYVVDCDNFPTNCGIVRALIAVRDGTWKDLRFEDVPAGQEPKQ